MDNDSNVPITEEGATSEVRGQATPGSSENPLEEHREAIERIRSLKVKLYGLLKRHDVQECQLGPILLQLYDESNMLHPEAMRNPEAMDKFQQQIHSVLEKGMQLMKLLNPLVKDIEELRQHDERWHQEQTRQQWAQILSRSTGKGKGKGKGKSSTRRPPSDSEERLASGEGENRRATKNTTHTRADPKTRSTYPQENDSESPRPGPSTECLPSTSSMARKSTSQRKEQVPRYDDDSSESSGFWAFCKQEYKKRKRRSKDQENQTKANSGRPTRVNNGPENDERRENLQNSESGQISPAPRSESEPATAVPNRQSSRGGRGFGRGGRRMSNGSSTHHTNPNRTPLGGQATRGRGRGSRGGNTRGGGSQQRPANDRPNPQRSTANANPQNGGPYPPYFNAYGQPWGYGAPYPPWGPPPMMGAPYSGDQSAPRNDEWSSQMLQEVGIQRSVKYPKNWKIPPPNQIPPEYRYYDVQRVISHGMIKPFMGTIEDYPRFQQSFYNMIHIQPGPIFQKVLALDKLITDTDTVRMLAGLGTTAGDYLSRIERLEQTYGGPNRLKNHHLRVLRKLEGKVDDSLENFKTYTYAVDNYLKNSLEGEADNLVLLHMLKGRMSRALRVEYNAYLQQERIEDDNKSVSLFLRNKLTTEIEAREEENAFPQSKKSTKAAKPKAEGKGRQPSSQQIHQAGRLWTSTEASSSEDGGRATHQAVRAARPLAAPRQRYERSKTHCISCNSDQHYITNCERFFLMTPGERRQLAADKNACYICISTSHRSKECPGKDYKRCGICKGKHHFLLHPPGAAATTTQQHEAIHPDPEVDSIEESDAQHLSCAYQEARKPKASEGPPPLDIAITYITVWVQNPKTGMKIKANLLADSGANSCSLDTTLGNELGLQGRAEPYYVQVGGGRINSYSAFSAPVIIAGTRPDAQEFAITVHVYDRPCGNLSPINWAEQKKKWVHLRDLDLPEAANRPVEGIIGTSEPILLAALQSAVVAGPHDPIATLTRLGWTVGGAVSPTATTNQIAVAFMQHSEPNTEPNGFEELRQALQRFWEADAKPSASAMQRFKNERVPRSERQAIEVFNNTLTRLSDGRYQVGLLWRNRLPLPRNFHDAQRMFYALERQLEKYPQMRINFNQTVTEWLNKEIACYVPSAHLRYFIPTFMVIRMDKATTAYRLVVDGARRFDGICINDRLLPGPSMINHIFDVLCRFRMGNWAFTCDVQTMYLNVRVRESDRKYLGMFFREGSNQPLKTIQITSHPFGLTSSPYVAMQVVNQHAKNEQQRYPLAAKVVSRGVIVDDFVISGDDVQLLQRTLIEVEALLQEICMGIHKVAASHPDIVSHVPKERIAKGAHLSDAEQLQTLSGDALTVKTLGIAWDTVQDSLSIHFRPQYLNETLTLRKVVSDGGRLYDPLGVVLPITMSGRILQQACWRSSSGWDQALDSSLQQRWKKWLKNTLSLQTFSIPRVIKQPLKAIHKQRLAVFVDASSEAQAAVCYVQTLYADGTLQAKLLAAKGRVSSLRKQESIPRLECSAAAMGAEFGHRITEVIGFSHETVVYFTDSMTTLWWIHSRKPMKVFIANRLCTILDHSQRDQWRFVKTDENPADIPTRTSTVKQLQRSNLWKFGPEFLASPEKEWYVPASSPQSTEALAEVKDEEARLDKVHTQTLIPYSALGGWLRRIWSRYSHPTKAFNVVAYVAWAIHFWRTRKNNTHYVSRSEINLAVLRRHCLTALIQEEQQRYFPDLVRQLTSNQPVKGRHACWRPFLDESKVIRINGRIGQVRGFPSSSDIRFF